MVNNTWGVIANVAIGSGHERQPMVVMNSVTNLNIPNDHWVIWQVGEVQ